MNMVFQNDGSIDELDQSFEPLSEMEVTSHSGSIAIEQVAQETPVAIVINGVSHAVMMCTPQDLEDFALGFGLSEGLLKSPADLLDVETESSADGISLQLRVTQSCEWHLKDRRRTLAGRTGCGLCGVESLASVRRPIAPVVPIALEPSDGLVLANAMQALTDAQTLNAQCGGLHAAGVFDKTGQLLLAREDVGRHNALDKLIGAVVSHNRRVEWRSDVELRSNGQRICPSTSFIAISSRASYEMVQKAASAGFGLLASVSAPTALAITTAQSCGLTLYGFVREGRATRYTVKR